MPRIIRWREGIDPEDVLWVCISCGAELNADCVGENCPACGTATEEKAMKTLLIWDLGNGDITVYECTGKIAKIAKAANGIYINSDNEEGDACEQMNELLGREPLPKDIKKIKPGVVEGPLCISISGCLP